MATLHSWEVSDSFWAKVEPLIPLPKRDPNKTYKRKPGAGRKPIAPRRVFEALKSRGFNFEETRLREAKRLETLCGVLAIAFCWAYHVGAWHNRAKPIALKTHQRPAKSLFRYGFDGIRRAVLNAADKGEQFEQILSLLRKALSLPKALPQPRYPA